MIKVQSHKIALKRFKAQFIDIFAHALFASVLVFPTLAVAVFIFSLLNISSDLMAVLTLVAIIAFWFIYFYSQIHYLAKDNATFGYKLMKIQIVYESGVTKKNAAIRILLKFLLILIMSVTWIPTLFWFWYMVRKGNDDASDLLDDWLGSKVIENSDL